ncbi:cytochrome b561 and DOMON domain-containing protein At5g35735-like [Neltuma alba]|uniref:cytochrome b561 and DOMON domain-containing protein At5g35735-like n=1 Tax=Neltuma alba TaxID=207710 RepID=UPI0010A55077|nr:cytochrome b561 and DOMON domain-containing protein At5g35735-like [Prosopis alba]
MSSSSSFISSLLILLLILAILCGAAFSQNDDVGDCSDDFWKLMKNKGNTTRCKSLRTLGAEFGWTIQLRNGTNGSTFGLDMTFGASLTKEPPAWIAWGVNPGKRPEMIGTKAIIGIIPNSDNSGTEVRTYEITKETRMGCHLGPSENLAGVQVGNTSIAYDQASGLYTISARLELNSTMYNKSRLNHVWQIGEKLNDDNNPQSHPTTLRNVDSTETIDLDTGHSFGQNRALLRKIHGALNIAGWGTFLPIGVIVARYFRVYPYHFDKWWKYLHVGCQSAGFIIGTCGWAIGLWLGHASKYYSFQTHRIFAIFIFTFTTIQMFALRLRPTEKDEYRKYWNMYHHFLGYGLLVIIIMNIFRGIHILQAGQGWKWAYVGILAFLGAITLGLESYTWLKFCVHKQNQQKKKTTEPEAGAEDKPAKA